MPSVSVIVPNYNHARYLNQRIDSILEQTYQDFELIILDDCSTDNSREVIETYRNNPHVSHIVYNETNGGSPFAQWNKGIELACGEWIWIAESDDWAVPDFLDVLLASQANNRECGLVYSNIYYMKEGQEVWPVNSTNKRVKYSGEQFIRHKLLFGNAIVNVSSVIFKKSLFDKINHSLYDKMRLCGDWFFYTLLCQSTNVLHIDAQKCYYRMHNSNTSKTAERSGLTFIEGIKILTYICNIQKIHPKEYAQAWGKKLSKYKRKYDIPKLISLQINFQFLIMHPGVLFYSIIYDAKFKIKSWSHLICQRSQF